MSIIDTLITDRTAADTAALEALLAKAKAGSLTEEERAILADPAHKGAYNHTDLNRVGAAMEYLRARLEGHGYAVKGYDRLNVSHTGAARLPEDYTLLEYIASSGTQYIDTGFGSTHGWQAELDWMFTVAPTTEQDVIGAIYYDGSTYFREYLISRNNQWSLGLYSSYSYSGSITVNTKYNIRASAVSSNGYLYVDGAKIFEYTTTYATHTPINVYIFKQNFDQDEKPAKGRLYSCKLYDETGLLVRDYVPCVNPDGEIGLYDMVNRQFYGNAGTGVFAGGPELKDESKDPYLWYESDIPAAAEMTRYLQNVSAIRAVLAALPTTPSVPADMEALTAAEANAIEVILMDVETLINNMIAAWLFCGDVYSGEV